MIEIRNIDGHLLYSTNAYLAMSDNDPNLCLPSRRNRASSN